MSHFLCSLLLTTLVFAQTNNNSPKNKKINPLDSGPSLGGTFGGNLGSDQPQAEERQEQQESSSHKESSSRRKKLLKTKRRGF